MPRWRISKKDDQSSVLAQSVVGDDARSAMFSLGLDDDQQLLYDAVMVGVNPPATVFTVCVPNPHPQKDGGLIEVMTTGSRDRAVEENRRAGGLIVEESQEVNREKSKERKA